ncbi:hypothetical protein QR680_003504 [Steinernema hermaphroditum]|uniref:Uncharacterized protein n=1 Tax=Steinernema hermaphroditum TaxID=289476 RepID=A0AA39HKM5_9BILA|nr:hypothetical protein QR680_003504 [Steinernema hermaphroditum]
MAAVLRLQLQKLLVNRETLYPQRAVSIRRFRTSQLRVAVHLLHPSIVVVALAYAGGVVDPSCDKLLLNDDDLIQPYGSTPQPSYGSSSSTERRRDGTSEENPTEDLSDFVEGLSSYQPVVPDAATKNFVNRAGLDSSDERIIRLFSLSSQKMVADVVEKAIQLASQQPPKRTQDGKPKITLTMEMLKLVMKQQEDTKSVKREF